MKKLLFTVAMTTFFSLSAFAADFNANANLRNNIAYNDLLGTCTITFTMYNSAGEAVYSWTEEYWAYSYQNCKI